MPFSSLFFKRSLRSSAGQTAPECPRLAPPHALIFIVLPCLGCPRPKTGVPFFAYWRPEGQVAVYSGIHDRLLMHRIKHCGGCREREAASEDFPIPMFDRRLAGRE